MYLISKILICLTLAFVIGLALGWLLRRSIALGRESASETAWTQRLRRAEQEGETALARLKGDVEEYRSQIPTLEKSLADRSDLIAQLEAANSELRDDAAPLRQRLEAIEANAASEQEAHASAREALAAAEAALADSERQVGSLQQELAAAQAVPKAARQAEERLAELQTALGQRDADCERLTHERDELHRQLEAAQEANAVQAVQMSELQSQRDALEERLADHTLTLAQLEGQHTEVAGQVTRLQAELDAARDDALRSRREGDAAADALAEARQQLAADDRGAQRHATQQQELDSERQRQRERLTELEQAVRASDRQVSDQRLEAERWREQHAALEQESLDRAQQLDALAAKLARSESSRAELAEQLQAREKRIADIEQALASRAPEDSRPQWLLARADVPQPDDLKKIRGIGPVLEATLNELGVWTFAQLGELDDADVHWLARHINTFPGRIRRDGWVEQARALDQA